MFDQDEFISEFLDDDFEEDGIYAWAEPDCPEDTDAFSDEQPEPEAPAAPVMSPAEATAEFNAASFILAKNLQRSLNDFETRLNNNIIVAGASGSGKTTGFVEPNLRAMVGSMVISDPKGRLHRQYAEELKRNGYNVVVATFQNPELSVRWNPLAHIRSTQDILRITSALVGPEVQNTHIDPYWDRMTTLLICSLIGYMVETDYQPCSFKGLLDLVREGERTEITTSFRGVQRTDSKKAKLRDRFDALQKEHPDSWACEQFRSVDQAPDRTYDTIRSTLAAKFSQYTTREIEMMMSGNDIDFEQIAQQKTAVFVLQSDCDRSMDGLVNLFFSQAINALVKYADTCENSRLPIPVRFFLDDYGATTVIDNLDAIISTIRSRAISVALILQSESQLAKQGGHSIAQTILANCDTYIYMGGNDVDTAKSVSLRCNKPLDAILYMPVGWCWVFTRGQKPYYGEIASSPQAERYYDERAEADRENAAAL